MDSEINIMDDAVDAVDPNNEAKADLLQSIVEKANELIGIDVQLEEIKKKVKGLNERKTALKQQEIPELMTQAGTTSIDLPNLYKVSIKDVLKANFPSETYIENLKKEKPDQKETYDEALSRREECLEFLRKEEIGLADIIKNNVNVAFGKGQDKQAQKMEEFLQQHSLHYEKAIGVAPGTLNKALKEKKEKGIMTPECFDAFEGLEAEIRKPPKSKLDAPEGIL